MVKNFVLDTNIMIHCPEALLKFEDNNIYIPHPVLEELDNLKTAPGETGFNARETFRILNTLRGNGKLIDGVPTPGGGKLYLFLAESIETDMLPSGWKKDKPDNLILLSALELNVDKPNVYMVTNDVNVQMKADILGIPFQEYKNDRLSKNVDIYTGRAEIHLNNDDFVKLIHGEKIPAKQAYEYNDIKFYQNQFLLVRNWENGGWLAKYDNGCFVSLEHDEEKPFGLTPRNAGQTFLQEALLSDKPLTICIGPAGTGKTLFAVGCGLEQVMEQHKYKRVLICRPNVTMDEDIGFLPGSEFEKISPLLRGCYDNLEVLLGNKDDDKETLRDKIEELFQREYVSAEAIAYLRGRSITNTFIIIDEAQNASPNQILSIITRAGEGSKIVIMGDPNQIDNNHLDKWNNGLTYACEKLKEVLDVSKDDFLIENNLVEICSFNENECTRSPLAKLASEKLKK